MQYELPPNRTVELLEARSKTWAARSRAIGPGCSDQQIDNRASRTTKDRDRQQPVEHERAQIHGNFPHHPARLAHANAVPPGGFPSEYRISRRAQQLAAQLGPGAAAVRQD